jgi:hypothetical protein
MKLTVALGVEGAETFDIQLNSNSFTQKWVNEFRWHLDHCSINQTEAFASLITSAESADILTTACKTINKYLRGFIEIRSDLENQPQEYFNYLHSKFEKISGSYDKPTRIFAIANSELKAAIRALNFYTHSVEEKKKIQQLYFSFDKDSARRQRLSEDDYQFYEFSFPPGTLHTQYVELGKEYIDLYEDGLPLDYSGFTNLHYYGGEAVLRFDEYNAFDDVGYYNWLVKNNIDPYNKRLGHSRIPLGTVVDLDDAINKFKNHRYLHSVTIKE